MSTSNEEFLNYLQGLKVESVRNLQITNTNITYCNSISLNNDSFSAEFKSIFDIVKLKEDQERLQILIKNLDNQIYQLCDHFFVEDYIDLDCENSQQIFYCQFCCLDERLKV